MFVLYKIIIIIIIHNYNKIIIIKTYKYSSNDIYGRNLC